MVYDCIPFFNELDILRLRLHILDPYVDRFVIEEATVTFSGEPKELCFEKNKELFSEFLHKIDYIVVDDSPVDIATHLRDKFQKNKLMEGLRDATDEDIIILSDVDEIPNPVQLEKIIRNFEGDKIYHLAQRMFYCFMNMEEVSGKLLSVTGEFAGIEQKQWLGTKIFSKRNIPGTGIIDIREADTNKSNSIRVENGGWHFGYMGGKGEKDASKRIGVKTQAAAHQEYNNPDTLAEAVDKLILGKDIFGRDAEFIRVEIDESYPEYLREHQAEYDYLIMPTIGKGQAEYTKAAIKVKRFFRKALRKSGRICDKVMEYIGRKRLAAAAVAGFVLSLIPEIYLAFINRASGDDYCYSVNTRSAWVDTHSLIEVCKGIGHTIREFYYGWQGTWFSITLFTLQPEVFSEKAYFLVTLVTMGIWVLVTTVVLRYFLVKKAGFEEGLFWIINVLFLMINMQFIPGIKASMFWYNGIIHYMLPYTMCLLLLLFLAKYVERYYWRDLGVIFILLTLLGGSNYQAALFGLMVTIFFLGTAYWKDKKIKIFWLGIPLISEMIGLVISMKAPGNKVRAGADFGFSIGKTAEVIAVSFRDGICQIGNYLVEKPIAMVLLLLLLPVLVWMGWQNGNRKKQCPYPGLFAIITFCIYCAMQAPENYAGTEVSSGVANMNYQIFLLMILADVVYLGGWLTNRGEEKNPHKANRLLLPAVGICLLLMVFWKGNLKDTTVWICTDYILSGQAGDYKEQMELQTAIMLDENVKDAVIPFINDIQGPLMHMPATADPEAWTNRMMRDFYRKGSVVAMDRVEWTNKYGDTWKK